MSYRNFGSHSPLYWSFPLQFWVAWELTDEQCSAHSVAVVTTDGQVLFTGTVSSTDKTSGSRLVARK